MHCFGVKKIWILLGIALAVCLSATSAFAASCQNEHCDCTGNITFGCGVVGGGPIITGRTYCLSSDVGGGGSSCLSVNVDDIIIDCYGWKFDGTSHSNSYAVWINSADNVTVYDCDMIEYDYGVIANKTNGGAAAASGVNVSYGVIGSSLNRIKYGVLFNTVGWSVGNYIQNNVFVYPNTAGVWITTSQTNVSDNNIYHTAGNATVLDTTNGTTIFNNHINESSWYGVYLYESSENNISNNMIYSHSLNNVMLQSKSLLNLIKSNIINDSTTNGLYISGSNWNNISDNNFWSNGANGTVLVSSSGNTFYHNNLNYSTSYGLALYAALENNISNNEIYSNALDNILLQGGSNANNMSYNIINVSTGRNGIYVSDTSTNNNLSRNHIYSNAGNGTLFQGCSRGIFEYNTIDNNAADGMAFYVDSFGNVSYNNIYSNGDDGISMIMGAAKILQNNTINDSVSDGIHLTGSTSNTLNNNTIFSTVDSGITLYDGSNANTINYSIINGSQGKGIWISNSDSVVIKNSNLTDHNYAFYSDDVGGTSDNNVVINTTIYNPVSKIGNTISFTYTGQVRFNSTSLPAIPSGYTSLASKALDISPPAGAGTPTVNIIYHYYDGEVTSSGLTSAQEDDMRIYRLTTGSTGSDIWTLTSGTVEVTVNNITGLLTAFSTFVPAFYADPRGERCASDSECVAGRQCVDGRCLSSIIELGTEDPGGKIAYTCTSAGHLCCDACDKSPGLTSYKMYHASCVGQQVCCDACNTTIVAQEESWWGDETAGLMGITGAGGLTSGITKGGSFVPMMLESLSDPWTATIWVSGSVFVISLLWMLYRKSLFSKVGESYFDRMLGRK